MRGQLLLLSRMKPVKGLVGVRMVHWRCRFPGRHGLHGHSKISHVGSQLHVSHVGDEADAVSRISSESESPDEGKKNKKEKKKKKKKKI